ncbi:Protein jim lovell [Frankliniella fusca]|uniref:Protein jim lovell n=1 Tax=Frankliniella fusca TaxID=407009 RepID=A0AAE1HIR1_9NEOP|nr:Protein jim lovell [Frankliniella fusca]
MRISSVRTLSARNQQTSTNAFASASFKSLTFTMRLIVVGDCVKLLHRTHVPSSSEKNNSLDQKGIKRGACEEAGCSDCDSYFHDPQRGSQCQYCGCFPTKHRRIEGSSDDDLEKNVTENEKSFLPQPPEIHIIDDGKGTMVYEVDDDGTITIPDDEDEPRKLPDEQNNSSLSNLLSLKDMNKQVSVNKNKENTPQKGSSATFASLTAHLPREELYEFCVPNHVPVLPSVNSKGECLDTATHFFLLRWISWSMFNLKLATEKDYVEVAKLTIRKYPELLSTLPPDSKDIPGMVTAMKSLLHKQYFDRRPANKKPQPDTKVTSRPATRKESIRISNNFSTVNVISSIKNANTGNAAKTMFQSSPSNSIVGQKAAITPIPASTPAPAPLPIPPAPEKHVFSKQFENSKEHIKKEMRKVNPSTPMLQTFLSSIRKDRMILAKCQSYATHIEEFPCLEIPDLVVWEFFQQEQLKCTLQDLKKKWEDALPQMIEYFLCGSKEDYLLSDPKTSDLLTMEILQTISTPAFFGPDQGVPKSEMRKSHVLEVFQGNILPLFVFPQKGDPPRLFSLGGADEVYVYLNGQSIYNGPVIDALIFVVAVYHVFCLTPAESAQAAFGFLFGILMQEKGIEMYKRHQFTYEALRTILKL